MGEEREKPSWSPQGGWGEEGIPVGRRELPGGGRPGRLGLLGELGDARERPPCHGWACGCESCPDRLPPPLCSPALRGGGLTLFGCTARRKFSIHLSRSAAERQEKHLLPDEVVTWKGEGGVEAGLAEGHP